MSVGGKCAIVWAGGYLDEVEDRSVWKRGIAEIYTRSESVARQGKKL